MSIDLWAAAAAAVLTAAAGLWALGRLATMILDGLRGGDQ